MIIGIKNLKFLSLIRISL